MHTSLVTNEVMVHFKYTIATPTRSQPKLFYYAISKVDLSCSVTMTMRPQMRIYWNMQPISNDGPKNFMTVHSR
jgi:hypothetical protein